MRPPRVKKLPVSKRSLVSDFPSFGPHGSVIGMRRMYYGNDALLVRCGVYVYNVTKNPRIYYDIAE